MITNQFRMLFALLYFSFDGIAFRGFFSVHTKCPWDISKSHHHIITSLVQSVADCGRTEEKPIKWNIYYDCTTQTNDDLMVRATSIVLTAVEKRHYPAATTNTVAYNLNGFNSQLTPCRVCVSVVLVVILDLSGRDKLNLNASLQTQTNGVLLSNRDKRPKN